MSSPKYILGIESSCDDTSVAIVSKHGDVLSSVTVAQNHIHSEFGGIYPEFASRAHVATIFPTIDAAFKEARLEPSDIKAIAVTRGPGLIGSLLVGINAAVGLSLVWNKPVIGVNHLRGHLRSADLEEKRLLYPSLVLLVSGGHTLLAFMKSSTDIEVLGNTLDDSLGEAFDKTARLLGLGFPGGPALDKLASTGTANISFPKPMIKRGLDFSFSGLKSAVARYVEQNNENLIAEDVAASFSKSCFDIVDYKITKAIKEYKPASLVVVGGVAASKPLRARLEKLTDQEGLKLCLPPLRWSTDNAAMIALAGWDYVENNQYIPPVGQARLSIKDY